MDTLNNDVSEIILAYLPDNTLLTMQNDSQLRYRIRDVYNSNTFWKRKVENKLGYDIDMYTIDWKDIYENINEDLNMSFRDAIYNGDTDVVKLLLNDPRVDPASENNNAIRGAAEYGRTDVVKLGMRSIPIYDHF